MFEGREKMRYRERKKRKEGEEVGRYDEREGESRTGWNRSKSWNSIRVWKRCCRNPPPELASAASCEKH